MARFQLLHELQLHDLELVDLRCLIKTSLQVALEVNHDQDLHIRCSCPVVAVILSVGRIVLHLTHDALVKLGQIMAYIEGVLG